MWEYLQINIGISLLAYLTLRVLCRAPARMRFYLAISALICWLMPWSWISVPLPDALIRSVQVFKVYELKDITQLFSDEPKLLDGDTPLALSSSTAVNRPVLSAEFIEPTSVVSVLQYVHVAHIFFVLLVIGMVLMFVECRHYRKMLRTWLLSSTPANDVKCHHPFVPNHVRIRYLQCDAPGMTTGVFKPTIWLGADQVDPAIIRSILVHELTHIKHHDVVWLWLINGIENLFWWNPLVKLLGKKARNDIEFSCDEVSKRTLNEGDYLQSFVQLVLSKNKQKRLIFGALTVRAGANLNIQRIEALTQNQVLTQKHVLFMGTFLLCATWVFLVSAYNEQLRDFYQSRKHVFEVHQSNALVEFKLEDRLFFEYMQHLYRHDLDAADQAYQPLLYSLLNDTYERKLIGFRVLAAFLGDANRYRDIPILLNQLFAVDSWTRDWEIPRIMAITYIRLGQYQQAVDILEASEAISYKGHPNRLLMAQAYHLLGDYQHSSWLIQQTLQTRKMSFYNTHQESLYKLLGKNALMLQDQQLMASAREGLNVSESYDFAQVRADQQRIPYIYFLYSGIDGENIAGFELDAFPLREELPTLDDAGLQKQFRLAMRAASTGDFAQAKQKLELALELVSQGDRYSNKDIVRMMEYLFVINMRLEMKADLVELSAVLAKMSGVSKDIMARAHWILASDERRYTDEGLSRFDSYHALSAEPTLSADHEMIERYYKQGDPHKAKPALLRVSSFYDQKQLVPDIRTLNRMIGVYERLGDRENETRYRALFAKQYPRALDFALDTFH